VCLIVPCVLFDHDNYVEFRIKIRVVWQWALSSRIRSVFERNFFQFFEVHFLYLF
jgi:hypothetical protein